MNRLTWIAILGIIGLLGFATYYAHAETYNDSTEFDIPDDAQFMEKQCQFKSIGEHLRYVCEWRFHFEQAQEWIQQQDEKFQEEINEIIEEQHEQVPEVEVPKTETEKLIERLYQERLEVELSSADAELLRLLESLNECYRGLGNSDPIQKDSQYEVPDDPRTFGKAYDYRSNTKLAKLVMAFEECRGQKTLESDITGPQYGNIAIATQNDTQKYHSETASHIKPVPSQKFYPEMMEKGEERALMTICLSDYYPQGFKIQMGCQISFDSEIKQFSEPELTDIQKEAHKRAGAICEMNMPNAYKRDMGCQIQVTPQYNVTNNVSILDNPVFNEWFHYNQDPVNNEGRQLEKIKKDALEKYHRERTP